MPTVVLRTMIDAPPVVCFDLIRDVRLQSGTAFVTNGEFGPGQRVTFEQTHFGMRQVMTLKVGVFERPHVFVDKMVSGRLKRFRHEHRFEPAAGGTLMTDTLDWTSPYGPIGWVVDKLYVERMLRKHVAKRNLRLKQLAEGRKEARQ
jgi:ligand-binding SRPBCC domain-containing protein